MKVVKTELQEGLESNIKSQLQSFSLVESL